MKNITRIIILVCIGIIAGVVWTIPATAQSPSFRIPITVTDTGWNATLDTVKGVRQTTLLFGVHPNATECQDTAWMHGFTDHWFSILNKEVYADSLLEEELPPLEPYPHPWRAYLTNTSAGCDLGNGQWFNIHQSIASSQVDTFTVNFLVDESDGGTSYSFTWPKVLSGYCDSMKLLKPNPLGAPTLAANMLTTYKYVVKKSKTPISKLLLVMWHPKVPPLPPATVVLNSPADGATDQDLNPTLTWTAGTGTLSYLLQIGTDSTMRSRFVFNDTLSATSKQITGLAEYTTYYWQVADSNDYGVSRFPQSPFRFTTTVLPPSVPVLRSPGADQQNVSVNPTLSWSRASIASTTYQVQVATDQQFSSLVVDRSVNNDSSTQVGPLNNCTVYYWRVKATNAKGSSNFSAARSFRTAIAKPATPTIVAPLDNATNVSLTATLQWSGDACANRYRLRVATDTGFSAIILSADTTSTSLSIGPLLPGTMYYWKVSAVNALDSSAYVVHKFATLISAPTLLQPADGATDQPTSPILRWNGIAQATGYDVQVSLTQDFSTTAFDSSIVDTSIQVPRSLNHCTQYFWRVRARNSITIGVYAAPRSLTVVEGIPAAPHDLTPANDKDSVDDHPMLTWAGDACTDSYFYHVAKSSSFTDTVAAGTTTSTSVTIGPLGPLTDYYWHVKAINAQKGEGPFTTTYHFRTTRSVPPETPKLSSPSNRRMDVRIPVTLVWDTAARADGYHVQLALDVLFDTLLVDDSSLTKPSKVVEYLSNSKLYYWRVQAYNAVGLSQWSEVWQFTTLYPPTAPDLLEPADGQTNVSTTPILMWDVATRADWYNLQISRDSSFINLVKDDTTVSNSGWKVYLDQHVKYYWRVRAKNSAGWSPWSVKRSFTTKYISPANWRILLTVAETGPARDAILFGVDQDATAGIDPYLNEFSLPPIQPGWFDVRFVSPDLGDGTRIDLVDFRNYTQVDTFQFAFQPGVGSYPMRISWSRSLVQPACDSMVMCDRLAGASVRVRMDRDSTLSVSDPTVHSLYILSYGAYPVPEGVKTLSPSIPTGFVLSQNYPNPFNPTTFVHFSTDQAAQIQLSVYDALGSEIVVLARGTFVPGEYTCEWTGKNTRGQLMPSGVYYVRMAAQRILDASDRSALSVTTRKMILMR